MPDTLLDASRFTSIPRAVMNDCFRAGMSMPETALIGRTRPSASDRAPKTVVDALIEQTHKLPANSTKSLTWDHGRSGGPPTLLAGH